MNNKFTISFIDKNGAINISGDKICEELKCLYKHQNRIKLATDTVQQKVKDSSKTVLNIKKLINNFTSYVKDNVTSTKKLMKTNYYKNFNSVYTKICENCPLYVDFKYNKIENTEYLDKNSIAYYILSYIYDNIDNDVNKNETVEKFMYQSRYAYGYVCEQYMNSNEEKLKDLKFKINGNKYTETTDGNIVINLIYIVKYIYLLYRFHKKKSIYICDYLLYFNILKNIELIRLKELIKEIIDCLENINCSKIEISTISTNISENDIEQIKNNVDSLKSDIDDVKHDNIDDDIEKDNDIDNEQINIVDETYINNLSENELDENELDENKLDKNINGKQLITSFSKKIMKKKCKNKSKNKFKINSRNKFKIRSKKLV